MYPNVITKTFEMPNGQKITIETGKLAKQADGSVVVRQGNTMLLATVVANQEAKAGVDFLPLSVDYQEKFASAGKIPGGFLRREGKLSDNEILISRLVDRAIRPMFPDDFHADVQINIFLISADSEVQPDALAGLAASAALAVSDIPFNGPISEVRVAKVDGQYLINPTSTQLKNARMDLIVAASARDILMVEGSCEEVSEEEILEGLKVAHDAIRIQIQAQKELEAEVGKTEKRTYSHEVNDPELKAKLYELLYDKVYAVAQSGNANKHGRSDAFKAIKDEYIASLPEDHTIDLALVGKYYHDIEKDAARNLALNENKRLDGRKPDEIRPIWCEVDYLPSPHGSSVFTRGETQSLTTVTLGTKLDEQIIDSVMLSGYQKFMLHYNFPGFSTGEVKPNRAPGRREVGHGNLAFRALKQVLPPDDENPYTIRVVSDILESNGSSSMATVCAGSLALMDAGVKIKGPVSGIAMGMISDSKTGKYTVLSDILGDEDHLGDMDFKVTGTAEGITACQMDIKVDGLSYEVLAQALSQAKKGRLHILGIMNQVISEPRPEMKPHAPRSVTIRIEQNQIGAVIGPGGKVVQEIQKESGATVVIEEKDNAGYVNIFATNDESMKKAVSRVKGIVAVPEIGEVYDGKVKTIMPFGAFVEFLPGKDGLLHISEIKWDRLESMEGVMEVGEEVKVKLVEIDKKTGKYRLSRKVLLPKPEGKPAQS
ncbi:polyribonucleotide nucleotidyltransferase [Cytophagaceae bacterium DM2B3-1]|uniref:Polyribonucleotide nucleotidyltransferase n=1 Tax=Xanthocytophaga flava TaxID=3048013 RepID=A0ABT7CMF0_9BACT|nr:polyribonucleotide nucleotidyltransferase [Xanthocytophaga flavus]MDJ1467548.1 polyribonucleotide nucleotidyltransferase [Xanthocytophaga flavus]MDJ1494921.1 polyribonucleotide nucleotidyltransferase [Xanthocytophaga flavus]